MTISVAVPARGATTTRDIGRSATICWSAAHDLLVESVSIAGSPPQHTDGAQCDQLLGELLAACLRAARDEEARGLQWGQLLGQREADAARAPGHQDVFALDKGVVVD